ncbi:MAG: hypothetical protein LC713_01975, partial [Actinobacteria bacterium]|nr:hypothetical protein [Actinomycetota bacterium]
PQGSAEALDAGGGVVGTVDLASATGPVPPACASAGGPEYVPYPGSSPPAVDVPEARPPTTDTATATTSTVVH